MEQKEINYLILAFVFLIIGIALIGAIATSTNVAIDKINVDYESHDISDAMFNDSASGWDVNESLAASYITVANNPLGWKSADCPLTGVTVENSSDGTYTAVVLDTDYNLDASTGVIHILNTSDTDEEDFNTTYISYTYCADDYLNSSWGRSVLATVPGFFALALLGVSLWLFYQVFSSVGIITKR